MNVAIEIPDEIGRALGAHAGDVSRAVLEAVAVEAYRSGTITPAQVQQMLGLSSRWETESFLRRRARITITRWMTWKKQEAFWRWFQKVREIRATRARDIVARVLVAGDTRSKPPDSTEAERTIQVEMELHLRGCSDALQVRLPSSIMLMWRYSARNVKRPCLVSRKRRCV